MPKPKLYPITLLDGTVIKSERAHILHKYRTGQKKPWRMFQWTRWIGDRPSLGLWYRVSSLWRRITRWVNRLIARRQERRRQKQLQSAYNTALAVGRATQSRVAGRQNFDLRKSQFVQKKGKR